MEAQIRLGIFLAIFITVAALEFWLPRRAMRQNRWHRWSINLSIIVINVIIQRLTLGAAAYLTAVWAGEHGWGLFNAFAVPFWIQAIAGFMLLDLAIYAQHVATHAIPVLWRLHQVHHADLDLDLTTGLRFHPVEILLSLVYKAVIVLAFGIDPWVVVIFEAALNGSAIFTHGNIRLPGALDDRLRLVVCTPDMHRSHHSVVRTECDSNYGFFLSVWDRLFKTMTHAPAAGHEGVVLGLPDKQDPASLGLLSLLMMPFRRTERPHADGKPDQAPIAKL